MVKQRSDCKHQSMHPQVQEKVSWLFPSNANVEPWKYKHKLAVYNPQVYTISNYGQDWAQLSGSWGGAAFGGEK